MKQTSNNISLFKTRLDKIIDTVLNQYKSATKGSAAFSRLATVLQNDSTGIGQSLISEHKVFQGYLLSLFNENIKRHGIDYVLNNIRGDFIDKAQLEGRYNEFEDIYKQIVLEYLKPEIELSRLIADTKLIGGNSKQDPDRIVWDGQTRKKVPKLMAHIFALWTLKNADNYFEAVYAEDRNSYLLQPHAAQVISIFRMLGIGDRREELRNNLIEIGTGEGKSITLAVTACILALLGFDVHCACYSEYLSQRDYSTFLSLFESLGLQSCIRYGTFNILCEGIINENGDVRQIVEQLISQKSHSNIETSQHKKRARILLIDEVDVFFSSDFYGNIYTPSATLRDPTITFLINFIWTQRKSKLNLNDVKITDEYKVCCNRFSGWESLIQEAVKDMLADVNNFESHDYVVNQNKIGYVEQDTIVYNVIYGYKTLFAYYYEYEKGNISKESLEEHISIKIKCGSFSYAEILFQFNFIMGVTGTLEALSDPEKEVIRNVYKIAKNTYSPSVFGKNNLKFTEKDDITIENNDDYFNVIKREIDIRLVGRSEGKRAVLIFFESEKKLKDFYESAALAPIKELVHYLTEEASAEEKSDLIRRATASNQVTLLTKTFGRGTDFVCFDTSVRLNGGVHVIQTFLSAELTEEVQIKGRTARQGDYGSYSMVLLDCDLEKFQIEKENIDDIKTGKPIQISIAGMNNTTKKCTTLYSLLHEKRTDFFKTQYATNTKYVELAKARHETAKEFLLHLKSGTLNPIIDFLVEENKGAGNIWSSRTICLMDATGSMSRLLHKCKVTVSTMFERASKVLKDNNLNSDSFQIQFAVYRNYNSKEDKILQSSPWETKPDNLRAFMNTISPEGGWQNEAIEIGLWHANKENERESITQVILIGDAPPNTKEEVIEKRQRYQESYWKQTKFAQAIYYENELETLRSHNIPVHAFFVAQPAEQAFRAISNKTGGRCEMLDINSLMGSQTLTDLVTEEILRSVGGSSQGDTLVQAYRNTFGRCYV